MSSAIDDFVFVQLNQHPKSDDIVKVNLLRSDECDYSPTKEKELGDFLEGITRLGKDILLSINTIEDKSELSSKIDRRLN